MILNFKNKFHYKDYIADIVTELDVSKDTYEQMFAQVFMDIYEKEQQALCVFNYYKINIANKIAEELKKIKRKDKVIFLPLFEEYIKLNNELDDIILKYKKKCQDKVGICKKNNDCFIEISQYPTLFRIAEHGELESFRPDLITSPEFIEFFKENIGKFGLYFLYNLNKELLSLGKSQNLGETIIDVIWKKNIDGFVAVAYTNTKADMLIYEYYYILTEKPSQMEDLSEADEISITLKPLKKTKLIKIYSNN
jgi:hypothetical protein